MRESDDEGVKGCRWRFVSAHIRRISEDISKCQAGYSEIVEAKKKKVAFVCCIYYFLGY